MSDVAYSLLDESLISTQLVSNETTKQSLPAILAGLSSGEVDGFAFLQPHQRQPWFSFLAQLGAIALAKGGEESLPSTKQKWNDLLMNLASAEAWALVVDDLEKPAFLQSPVPEGSLGDAGYKADIDTPDLLDMLVTSKNHDVKRQRIRHPDIEHWIFALVTLQTLEGFLGRGNYGITRMNGGFAARPFVGFSPGIGWAARFRHDVERLLETREEIAEAFSYALDGPALLWTIPWDGKKKSGLDLHSLDPLFIEICRRIRFTNSGITCWRSNTKGARIETDKKFAGITGDPWTPIDKKDAKAMNMVSSGFPYPLVRKLLIGEDLKSPPALAFRDQAGFFIGVGLTRGQGKTDGLHRRIVPIPGEIVGWLAGDDQSKEQLARLSAERVEDAGRAREKMLRPALYQIMSGGTSGKVDYDKIRRWEEAFEATVDEQFFSMLWEDAGRDEDEASERWRSFLYEQARDQFEDAINSAGISAARKYRVIANAESVFYSRAYSMGFKKPSTTMEAANE